MVWGKFKYIHRRKLMITRPLALCDTGRQRGCSRSSGLRRVSFVTGVFCLPYPCLTMSYRLAVRDQNISAASGRAIGYAMYSSNMDAARSHETAVSSYCSSECPPLLAQCVEVDSFVVGATRSLCRTNRVPRKRAVQKLAITWRSSLPYCSLSPGCFAPPARYMEFKSRYAQTLWGIYPWIVKEGLISSWCRIFSVSKCRP